MAEQIIQVPPDAGGKKVRTQEVVAGGNVVEMETVVLGDPTNVGNLALVTATGALKVDNSAVTQPVSGTFFQATQPISGSVSVSNFPVTQPVSGTVSVTNFANPLPVTLTSTAVTGNVTVVQPTGTNLHTVVDILPAIAGTVGVNNFPATQPVSGTVAVSNFPASQSVSGTVAISNLPLGQQLSPASLPVVLASDQVIDNRIHDSVGEDLYSTNNALNVHLAGNELFNLDGNGSLAVNVQGTVPVSVLQTLPVVVTSHPLPPNASQEVGGNLATISAALVNAPSIGDLLNQILVQLKILNLNFASSTNDRGLIDDPDAALTNFLQ